MARNIDDRLDELIGFYDEHAWEASPNSDNAAVHKEVRKIRDKTPQAKVEILTDLLEMAEDYEIPIANPETGEPAVERVQAVPVDKLRQYFGGRDG